VGLVLHTEPQPVLNYSGLTDLDPAQVTPQQVYDRVCDIRRSKLPDPSVLPNAGSFFKNPIVSSDHFDRLHAQHPDIVSYPAEEGCIKLAAGWLIDRCQWKGVYQDGVGVHDKQALVLVNREAASATPLLKLAEDIQASVFATFAVKLEAEPTIIV
jgi:UDP-N-acetylmuramate dehydrogenase